jgi:hypothetical protein
VNPSIDMFREFFKLCQKKSTKLQVQALSSYGGIRIWRVEAFAFTSQEDPSASTGKSIQLPDVFGTSTDDTDVCGNQFNVIVTSMEYLNFNNIAIQVMNAAPAYIDPDTMKPRGNDPQNVTYLTYFLQPVTMQVRQGIMWESDSAVGQLSSGSSALCPEWRQMPQFGSMAAEMAASAILATRMMVSFIITAPIVFQPGMYERIQECPLVPRGHSMLLNCGRNFLNLDASFAAMRVANSHLWNSLAKIGNLLQKDGGTVQTFLTGNAVYNTQVHTLPLSTRVLFIQYTGTHPSIVHTCSFIQYTGTHPSIVQATQWFNKPLSLPKPCKSLAKAFLFDTSQNHHLLAANVGGGTWGETQCHRQFSFVLRASDHTPHDRPCLPCVDAFA